MHLQTPRPPIAIMLDRHAEDASFLWLLRDAAVASPKYTLRDLAELDGRLEAHLAGLRLAGDSGWQVARLALALGEPGEAFVAAVLAFASGGDERIGPVLRAAEDSPANFRAVVAALGWLDDAAFRGIGRELLHSAGGSRLRLGIAACAVRRLDPGAALTRALDADDPGLRARALRAAGELQRSDLLPAVRGQLAADDAACRFWAAWSSVLLGDCSPAALAALRSCVDEQAAGCERAARLLARTLDARAANGWLRRLASQPALLRLALIGAGATGDPAYITTLIKYMEVTALARVSGEAFSLITGADLALLDLDRDWPEGFESGPSEDPLDDDVALDVDEDLPWPDPQRVAAWWQANRHALVPGRRYLCGHEITLRHCDGVLGRGNQRQRQAAALEQLRLRPGRPLFEVRAPGFRQRP